MLRAVQAQYIIAALLMTSGCASIRELSPDTAASRISSSDGYKDEACQIMAVYVEHAMQMNWDQAVAMEPMDENDIRHYGEVFAAGPEVTCRMTVAGRMIDLEANEFAEFLKILPEMQAAYRLLPAGGSVQDCPSCSIQPFRSSNDFLERYFKQPPFPTVQEERNAQRRYACLATPDEIDSSQTVRQGFTYPLSKGPTPCHEVWRAELSGDAMLRCSRYGSSSYLICPNGVWNDESHPPKPFSHVPQGYSQIHTFGGGFVLTLLDGSYDVYWLNAGQRLEHATLQGRFHILDVDDDHRLDAVVSDELFHASGDGTATRKSLEAFREKDTHRQRQAWSNLQGLGMKSWPLDYVEQMLLGPYAGNKELIDRASDLSLEWLRQASQRSTQELIQAYWHAALWNRLSGRYEIPDYFENYLRGNVPKDFRKRKAAISNATDRSGRLHQVCESLRSDMHQVVDRLQQVRSGTELAAKSIGAAWERYASLPIPYPDAVERHRAAERIAEETETFLREHCL